ncbi:MAG TPA: antibiotic biosynthesis monooxygenase [Candidatus Dormibacteraeota bacterium]|jgi:heme-degrading monooxygenase HmoA
MYGTIAKFKVKADKEAELREHINEFGSTNTRGFVASALYRADAGGQEYWLAVIFEDQASYRANAESPEQDARYQVMRSFLEDAPEWHDGEVIGRFTAGP